MNKVNFIMLCNVYLWYSSPRDGALGIGATFGAAGCEFGLISCDLESFIMQLTVLSDVHVMLIIIIIFIETRLPNAMGKIIKYRWFG